METLFVGRNIIFLSEVYSTNSYAINLLKNVNSNVAEGSVVYATEQTAGRGQRGNVWNTEGASNLTASIILKPTFVELKNQFFLYQIAALACYDVLAEILENSQYDIKIKWPNDILVNGKKNAGVLIENIIINNRIGWSVMGIGINVNQVEFKNDINANSLKLLTAKDFSIDSVLKLLCKHLEKYYLMLKNEKTELIKDKYLSCFLKKDKWQKFEIENTVKTLLVKGISNNGLLLLEDETGKQNEFDIKEVKWLI